MSATKKILLIESSGDHPFVALTENENVLKEWHAEKNKNITPEQITPGSAKRYWWICSQGHEWKTSVVHRTKNQTGCPYCCNQKIEKTNSLAVLINCR